MPADPPPDDRDLSALLPEAPPPRPAAQQAAIEAALLRFDGEAPRPTARRRPDPARAGWHAIWGRPQMSAFIAASLVAGVVLPIWLIADQRPMPARAPVALDAEAPPAVLRSHNLPLPVPSAEPAGPQEAAAPAAVAPRAPAEQAESERAAMDLRDDSPAPFETADLAQRAGPAPPPPPPPAMIAAPAPAAVQEDAADHDDVIVTGTLRAGARSERQARSAGLDRAKARPERPSRAAEEACTVNDPRRSLLACRAEIDPAAAGAQGRAAAHLSDGLSRAWRGDLDRAIAAFDRAIAAMPGSAAAYYNRGLAYGRKGDAARAQADLERAASLDPRYRR